MEPEGSSPISQKPATGPYPELTVFYLDTRLHWVLAVKLDWLLAVTCMM
jgi:hypothetical protein